MRRITIIFFLSIALALISPPFIFASMDFASRELRALLGLVLIGILVLSTSKFRTFDGCALLLAAILFIIEIVWQRSQLSNIFSYYSVVVVYVLLFRALRINELSSEIFLSLWIRLAYLISILSILAFIIHQFTSLDTDFLNFPSRGDFSGQDYKFSIFGLTQDKNFGFATLARVDSYFYEPQYAGLYFAINALIAKKLNKLGLHRYLLVSSALAGMLTFSVTFYLAMMIHFFFYLKSKEIKVMAMMGLFALIMGCLSYVVIEDITPGDMSFVQRTSFDDRWERFINGVGILSDASLTNLLLGHGVGYTNDFSRGISSGFFQVWVERGLAGLCFVLAMLVIFSKNNREFTMVCLLFLLAVPWYVSYIYWIGLVMFWAATTIVERRMKRSSDSGCLIRGM